MNTENNVRTFICNEIASAWKISFIEKYVSSDETVIYVGFGSFATQIALSNNEITIFNLPTILDKIDVLIEHAVIDNYRKCGRINE